VTVLSSPLASRLPLSPNMELRTLASIEPQGSKGGLSSSIGGEIDNATDGSYDEDGFDSNDVNCIARSDAGGLKTQLKENPPNFRSKF